MLTVAGRRLAMAVPTLLAVSVVIFLLLNVLPGDPLAGLLAPDASADDRAALAHSLGLDQPLPMQYASWMAHLAQGDLGQSFSRRRAIAELIQTAFGNTLLLASCAAVFGLVVGSTL